MIYFKNLLVDYKTYNIKCIYQDEQGIFYRWSNINLKTTFIEILKEILDKSQTTYTEAEIEKAVDIFLEKIILQNDSTDYSLSLLEHFIFYLNTLFEQCMKDNNAIDCNNEVIEVVLVDLAICDYLKEMIKIVILNQQICILGLYSSLVDKKIHFVLSDFELTILPTNIFDIDSKGNYIWKTGRKFNITIESARKEED